ncbi:hypothetical protein NH44784_006771 [Achromobacter xylosoxidans NH44784-1996]|nr:hypothetical protein NH44784_006771 [Achromobacter xylosoxidans NH44784-1996]
MKRGGRPVTRGRPQRSALLRRVLRRDAGRECQTVIARRAAIRPRRVPGLAAPPQGEGAGGDACRCQPAFSQTARF